MTGWKTVALKDGLTLNTEKKKLTASYFTMKKYIILEVESRVAPEIVITSLKRIGQILTQRLFKD